MSRRDLKIVAATITACGFLFSVLGEIFGPDEVVWHAAPWYGKLSGNLGWWFLLVAPLIYIRLDWSNLFPPKKEQEDEEGSN